MALPFLRDTWTAFIKGQTDWRTNRLPVLRDKWTAFIEGQTGCPFWKTKVSSCMLQKCDVLPRKGQMTCPLRHKWVALLRDKQISLLGGQMCVPGEEQNVMSYLRDKQMGYPFNFEGQICPLLTKSSLWQKAVMKLASCFVHYRGSPN